MAFSANFTAAQSPLTPAVVVLADTSTGSDVLIISRRIYITDFEGNPVVPNGTSTDYIDWPLAQSSINLTILQRDMALTITVKWLDVSNNPLYTLTQVFCFSIYTKQFLYMLVEGQSGLINPVITSDTNYDFNLGILWTAINGAMNAIELAADVQASQSCLNRAYRLMQTQTISF